MKDIYTLPLHGLVNVLGFWIEGFLVSYLLVNFFPTRSGKKVSYWELTAVSAGIAALLLSVDLIVQEPFSGRAYMLTLMLPVPGRFFDEAAHQLPVHAAERVEVVNATAGDMLKENPALVTTKADREAHGLGLKIVRNLVERYEGMYQVSGDSGSFRTVVLLSLE